MVINSSKLDNYTEDAFEDKKYEQGDKLVKIEKRSEGNQSLKQRVEEIMTELLNTKHNERYMKKAINMPIKYDKDELQIIMNDRGFMGAYADYSAEGLLKKI